MYLHITMLTLIIYIATGAAALPLNYTETLLDARDLSTPIGIIL